MSNAAWRNDDGEWIIPDDLQVMLDEWQAAKTAYLKFPIVQPWVDKELLARTEARAIFKIAADNLFTAILKSHQDVHTIYGQDDGIDFVLKVCPDMGRKMDWLDEQLNGGK